MQQHPSKDSGDTKPRFGTERRQEDPHKFDVFGNAAYIQEKSCLCKKL